MSARSLRRRTAGWVAGWCAVCAALAGTSPKAAQGDLPAATVSFWDRVAQCETGSRWAGLGSVYQGGLGIYYQTWDWWAKELGLWSQYPDAGMAPRLVQIRVADYGRRKHRGYWGCI